MPRPTFLPTPAPSMDIVGETDAPQLASNEKASFTLPPPAIASLPGCDAHAQEQGCRTAQVDPEYSLPPPPTRARKIIQMTPGIDVNRDIVDAKTGKVPAKPRPAASAPSATSRKGTGKKQPSSTSQAGKRIARKTAHSVIERRRRSKMNEEFGVLKDMIPACKDQDMHKLAILQASIEYLRYLEQCVTELKTANGRRSGPAAPQPLAIFQQSRLLKRQSIIEGEQIDDGDDDEAEEKESDVDMSEQLEPSPPQVNGQHRNSAYTSPCSITASPNFDVLSQSTLPYTSPLSSLPSPAVGPLHPINHRYLQHSTSSASTSPTLQPTSSKEADEEATAALLMLNKDRRNTNTSSNSSTGRGMSVKDLLSS